MVVINNSAYPGVRDNRSTLNTKTGYDETMIHVTSAWPPIPGWAHWVLAWFWFCRVKVLLFLQTWNAAVVLCYC